MTDKDIIKALEELLDKIRAYECNNASISKGLIENIINLIDRLQVKNKELDEKLIIQKGLIETQKAEIERLTEENKKMSAYVGNGWGYVSFLEFAKNQRAEAIKEFAERLRLAMGKFSVKEYWEVSRCISNLVKEMTEGCENGELHN